MKKNKILLSLLIAFGINSAMAQEHSVKNVSLELMGAHTVMGVNFDSRLKGNNGLGFRVGVSIVRDGLTDYDDVKGFAVPLELNYLLGEKNHHLELGAGVSLGSCKFGHYNNDRGYFGDRYITIQTRWDENRFAYFIFGNVGYRYQRPSGFVARVGLTPSFNFGGENGFDRPFFYPYVGLGWSF